MALEPDEMCCICFNTMKEGDNLTFCKVECGRNIHTECMEKWAKSQTTCPLCRTDWGPNCIEELKETTKQWKELQRIKRMEESKQSAKDKRQIQMKEATAAIDNRSFKCKCCKKTVIYEPKYQCLVCPETQICRLCFKGGYHDHHQFVLRAGPDKDWEAAFREGVVPPGDPVEAQALYAKVKEELKEREISSENFNMLLHFEGKEEKVPFGKFCALAFMKEYKNPDSYFQMPRTICGSCDLDIQDRSMAVQLHHCDHHIHKTCLEDCFEFPEIDQENF